MRVYVKFKNYGKLYGYNTNKTLIVGGVYSIIADGRTSYDSPVTVVDIESGTDKNYRMITDAELISAPKVPKPYKHIFVDKEKETVCVVWLDGSRTIMKPHGEPFDIEKGIALCFMKKQYGNRGCFNNAFKDITEM